MARAYAGTVMLEGTTLSEGRGTTRPLELFGAPDIDARAVIAEMQALAPAMAAAAARCATAGSSRPSTSMSASSATACRSSPKAPPTTTTPSGPGGCRRWPSRRSAGSIPTIDLWRDFRLRIRARQAGHRRDQRRAGCCANGSTTRRPRRPTWTPRPCPTRRPGRRSAGRSCATPRTRLSRRKPGPRKLLGRDEDQERGTTNHTKNTNKNRSLARTVRAFRVVRGSIFLPTTSQLRELPGSRLSPG